MSWRSEEWPVGFTCPDIDAVKTALDMAIDELNNLDAMHEGEVDQNIVSELESAKEIMEDLRSANSTLRSWGSELLDEREDVSRFRDELESTQYNLERAEEKIEELEDELESEVNRSWLTSLKRHTSRFFSLWIRTAYSHYI